MTNAWPGSPDEMRQIFQAAVADHGKAHALAALSSEYGIPNRTVRRHLERAEVIKTSPRPRRPLGPELLKLYESLHDADLPHKTIPKVAEALAVSGTTAWRWLAEAGIHEVKPEGPRGIRLPPVTGNCPCGTVAVTRYKREDPPLCMPCYQKKRHAGRAHRPLAKRNGRLEVAAFKKDKPCADCGVQYPPCVMDFDHVPERGPKLFHLGQPERNLKEVRAELAKCDLVCANCHRIRTWKRRQARKEESA
jgi:hypothetical protein